MDGKDFNQLVKGLERIEEAILLSKGKDYTRGDADRLKNFKMLGSELVPMLKEVFNRAAPIVNYVADESGKQPEVDAAVKAFHEACPDCRFVLEYDEAVLQKMGTMIVFWVYFRKHVDALASYIKSGQVESEGLMGRINDIRNYAALGAGLMVDFGDMKLPEVQ